MTTFPLFASAERGIKGVSICDNEREEDYVLNPLLWSHVLTPPTSYLVSHVLTPPTPLSGKPKRGVNNCGYY